MGGGGGEWKVSLTGWVCWLLLLLLLLLLVKEGSLRGVSLWTRVPLMLAAMLLPLLLLLLLLLPLLSVTVSGAAGMAEPASMLIRACF